MKILRFAVISLLALSAAVIFLFLLFPSQIQISRVIIIHASQQRIAARIRDFDTWHEWNHFTGARTLIDYQANAISDPASSHSDSLRIDLVPGGNDSIKTYWHSAAGKPIESVFLINPLASDSAGLQWYFTFHLKWYPWEKLGSMFYDRQMGPLLEISLLDLKHLVENNP